MLLWSLTTALAAATRFALLLPTAQVYEMVSGGRAKETKPCFGTHPIS